MRPRWQHLVASQCDRNRRDFSRRHQQPGDKELFVLGPAVEKMTKPLSAIMENFVELREAVNDWIAPGLVEKRRSLWS